MTKEQIEKKALEAYPYGPDPINAEFQEPIKRDLRKGYIKALTDFFTPEMMWKIFQTGKEVVDELNGKETTIEYVGSMILRKL